MLDDDQIERYSRQILLPEVGGKGQERLRQSRVLLVGAGRLGRLVASYLIGAGIGHLDWSPGVETADTTPRALVDDLAAINPEVRCDWRDTPVALGAATTALVAVGSAYERDRDQANWLAVSQRAPLVAASATPAAAWVGVFAGHLGDSACLRCAAPVDAAVEEHSGTRRSLAAATLGLIASLQATTLLSLLLDIAPARSATLWRYDTEAGVVSTHHVSKDPSCAVCRQ